MLVPIDGERPRHRAHIAIHSEPEPVQPRLAALFLGTFVLGTAELIVVGVLDLIAADLAVSLPAAGALVTANALGIAIGGPILTGLTTKLNKRTVLIGALALFIVATLVPVLTANYALFVFARTGAGAMEGLFIASAFAAGASVVPPERMGRAFSIVISGVAVSAAVGVPLGTLIGQTLGWRGTFTSVVALAAIALAAVVWLVPSVPAVGGSFAGQAKHAFAPRVLAILGLNFLVFAALFATLTYIIPFLQTITGISGALLSVFLLAYGVATAVGSFGGGRFADINAGRTLLFASIGVAASLLTLYLVGTVAVLVAIALRALGLFGFSMVPSMQYRVVSLAAREASSPSPCPHPRSTSASRSDPPPAVLRSAPFQPPPQLSPGSSSRWHRSQPPGRPACSSRRPPNSQQSPRPNESSKPHKEHPMNNTIDLNDQTTIVAGASHGRYSIQIGTPCAATATG